MIEITAVGVVHQGNTLVCGKFLVVLLGQGVTPFLHSAIQPFRVKGVLQATTWGSIYIAPVSIQLAPLNLKRGVTARFIAIAHEREDRLIVPMTTLTGESVELFTERGDFYLPSAAYEINTAPVPNGHGSIYMHYRALRFGSGAAAKSLDRIM